MQVRGIPNPQMVGNRLMAPQGNVSNQLTAMAHAQQRKQQTRPMVPPNVSRKRSKKMNVFLSAYLN